MISTLKIGEAEVEDTFAEAFKVFTSRILVTAKNERLALTAATEATGFGTSLVMCPAEAGIDSTTKDTPDGRPGVVIQICHSQRKKLENQLLARIGQCVLTAPTAAAFNALDSEDKADTGEKLKYFGDGFESYRSVEDREVVVIPIMSGEFLVENKFGIKEAVAGGNFLILGKTSDSALEAAERAVEAIGNVEGTFTPFPGGIVSSGSKVGALKYKFLHATTNHEFCPTIRDKVKDSKLPEDVESVYEIVVNGLDLDSVKKGMSAGIKAASEVPGIVKFSAGNYGGELGQYEIHLKDLI